MSVVCRFAPSPTGLLHVGGARTALFNWAFARHEGGSFLLRIEDTDKERSTAANEQAILDALDWLEMQPDGTCVRQSERGDLYQQHAMQLLEEGKAYRCYATQEELEQLRADQEARKEKPRYDRRWRDRTDHPENKPFCIRFATPIDGATKIDDLIRGQVTVDNAELDDLVIMRADGTATYNFAAAVDDAQMKVTHVIRGEDHLTNTIRQVHIHQALGDTHLQFAHLPMILGRKLDEKGEPAVNEADEAVYERLSKRNQAVDIDHYRKQGYLAQAMINYLAQLGWTQPDKEIYSPQELADAFDITKVNRSAARFDLDRLRWINQQHLRGKDAGTLKQLTGIDAPEKAYALACEKAHTVIELKEELAWLTRPEDLTKDLDGQLRDDNQEAFFDLCKRLESLEVFDADAIKAEIKQCCKAHGLGFARLGMPLRVALTGKEQSPDIAQIAELLGHEEVKARTTAWS